MIEIEVHAESAFAKLEGVSPKVLDRFAALLKPVEEAMLTDAKSRALAHFHSVADNPAKSGLYLAGFEGAVNQTKSGVVGYIRNGNNLAHLLERGFTIKEWQIIPGTGAQTISHLGAIMKFSVGVGDLYRAAVHRHATKVNPYPAIQPAFDALRSEVGQAAEAAVQGL